MGELSEATKARLSLIRVPEGDAAQVFGLRTPSTLGLLAAGKSAQAGSRCNHPM
jgi:hypothetical protein